MILNGVERSVTHLSSFENPEMPHGRQHGMHLVKKESYCKRRMTRAFLEVEENIL